MLGAAWLGRVGGRPFRAGFRLVRGLWGRGLGQEEVVGVVGSARSWSCRAGAGGVQLGLRSVEGEVVSRIPWGLGCVRLFKSIAGRGPFKGRSSPKHFKLNEEIKAMGSRGGAARLLEIVQREGGAGGPEALDFNHVNCCNWLNKLVKGDVKGLQREAPVEVVQVLERALYLLRETPAVFDPRGVANLANAVSQLQYRWEGGRVLHVVVLEELGKWVANRKEGMGDFNAFDIANFINGFAKVGLNPGEKVLRQVVAACLEMKPESFAPQGLSNVANGFAKLGEPPGKALLDLISRECVRRRLEDFKPQEIANIANALAAFKHHPGEALLALISKECVGRKLEGFTPQAIANIINALAAFEFHRGKELLDLISKECVGRRLEGFKPQHIANIVNAFAKLDTHPGEELLDLISRECVRRKLDGFNAQDIANIMNALAAFKHHPGEALLGMVLERCQILWKGFNGQEMSNVLHGLAILRCVPVGEWMARFHKQCEKVGWKDFSNQGLRLILWACTVLEVRVDKGLVEALTARLRTFKDSVDQGAKRLDYQDAIVTCTAVRQALFLLDTTREEGLQELSEAAEAAWEVVKGRDKPPIESELQKGVVATLKASYRTLESEVMLADGLLSLDAVITLRCGSKVGVEVDGPPHFFRNRPDVPTGDTLIKWRMLEKGVELGLLQGWVSVQNGSERELAKAGEAVRRVDRGRM